MQQLSAANSALCKAAVIALGLSIGAPAAGYAATVQVPEILLYGLTFPPPMRADTRQLIEDILLQKLSGAVGARVLGRRDLSTMVAAQGEMARAAACGAEHCLLQVKALAAVRFFVSGVVSADDHDLVCSLKLFDRQNGSVAVRVVHSLGHGIAAITGNLDEMAQQIGRRMRQRGWIGGNRPPRATAAGVMTAVTPGPSSAPWLTSGRIAALSLGGLAVAGGVTAGVFELLAAQHHSRAADSVGGQLDNAAGMTDQNDARVIGIVSAGVLLTGGVVWLFTGPRKVPPAVATVILPTLRGGAVVLAGRW